MMKKTQRGISQTPLLILIALASLVVGYLVSQSLQSTKKAALPQDLDATVLDNPRPLVSFELMDHNKQAFNPESLKGQWSFLFFGYTHCPDVCPAALKIMQMAWKDIPHSPEKGTPAKMIFVSVDPDRDSVDMLEKYVTYFHPTFLGVTGNLDELDKLTNQIGILYGYEDKEKDGKNYVVNHSAQFILVNPLGQMHAVFSPPYGVESITNTFSKITEFYGR